MPETTRLICPCGYIVPPGGFLEVYHARHEYKCPKCQTWTHERHWTQQSDNTVNHPPHYTFSKYEVIDVLEAWFPDEALLWQVVKYVARAGRKGPMLEDLRKAEFYLKRRIERAESEAP